MIIGKVRASEPEMNPARKLPLWVKLVYTAWFVLWVVNYWQQNGPQNFLWICDLGNFVLLIALWRESRLLLSAVTVGVILLQGLWAVDFLGRLLFGVHLIGGTEYMWDEAKALSTRLHSLFHLWVPVLLLAAVRRLGYDRRAFRLTVGASVALFPLSYLLTDPEHNINWLWKPFGVDLPWLAPAGVVVAWIVLYPSMVVWPVHRILIYLSQRRA